MLSGDHMLTQIELEHCLNGTYVSHYSGELPEWIENRLEELREIVAELNDSTSNMDDEETMEDEATDTQTGCELLVATADKFGD